MTKRRIYLAATLTLLAANIAAAAAPREVETTPWGACFMDAGGGNCSCEFDTVDPDCAGVGFCQSQYPVLCPVE